MEKVLDFLKKHVKVTLAVAAFGIVLTLGLNAEGCSVDAAPDVSITAPAEAAAE